MSIIRCSIHDHEYDSDVVEDCKECLSDELNKINNAIDEIHKNAHDATIPLLKRQSKIDDKLERMRDAGQ